jgi:hypothetical protein
VYNGAASTVAALTPFITPGLGKRRFRSPSRRKRDRRHDLRGGAGGFGNYMGIGSLA